MPQKLKLSDGRVTRSEKIQKMCRKSEILDALGIILTTHSMVYKGQRENVPRGVPNNYLKYA